MKNEIAPEIKTDARMIIKISVEGWPIKSLIAAADPVLVFEIAYRDKNEKTITSVFVAPCKTKNPFLSLLEITFPRIAACPLPRPGRKPHNGEAISEPSRGLSFFVLIADIF